MGLTSRFNDSDESSGSASTGGLGSFGTGALLLPLSIFGIYAFIDKAAVLSAVTSVLGGASGIAAGVTAAFWIIGLLVVIAIVGVAVLTAWSIILALVKRSVLHAIAGALGMLYFVVGYGVAINVFPGLPLLVAFVLATNLAVYGGLAIVMFVVLAGVLAYL